jgi:hypothetical protein
LIQRIIDLADRHDWSRYRYFERPRRSPASSTDNSSVLVVLTLLPLGLLLLTGRNGVLSAVRPHPVRSATKADHQHKNR